MIQKKACNTTRAQRRLAARQRRLDQEDAPLQTQREDREQPNFKRGQLVYADVVHIDERGAYAQRTEAAWVVGLGRGGVVDVMPSFTGMPENLRPAPTALERMHKEKARRA